MNATDLNRWGLILGLLSGLMLIPELFNRLPIVRIERSLELLLDKANELSEAYTKYHPPLWKVLFKENIRKGLIERVTTISSFIFSAIWVSGLFVGFRNNSIFFITFSLLPPLGATINQMLLLSKRKGPKTSIDLIILFFISGISVFIFTPPISTARMLLVILGVIARKLRNLFSKYDVAKNFFFFLAILAFVLSNVLQLLATYHEPSSVVVDPSETNPPAETPIP